MVVAAAFATSACGGTKLGSALPSRMPESSGKTFWVSGKTGRDSWPGTKQKPWRSITRALARVPANGSRIRVRGGTYVGTVVWRREGNPEDPVTLEAAPGERPLLTVLPGRNHHTVQISHGGFRLRGFEITSPEGNNGVRIENAHDVEVADNVIHDTGHMGLQVLGTGTRAPTGSRDVQVWNNHFYDNGGAWISEDDYWVVGDHSIYWGGVSDNNDGIDHTAYGGVIANNLFDRQPYGRQLQIGSQVDGLIVTNNTFAGAQQTDIRAGNAIQVYGEDNRFAPRNVKIVNNIISFAANRGVYGSGGSDVMESNLVTNNLAYGNPKGDFLAFYGDESNVLFRLGTNYTGKKPQFSRGFRLQRGSPAIGKADPKYAPATDFNGRPRKPAPDLGAFESHFRSTGG